MPAIVRQTMGRGLAKALLADIQNSANEYYIGIGKSDLYNLEDTTITPIDSSHEEREFRNNLQSIKKVEGSSFVAKRVNWSSGTIYAGWDDYVDEDSPTAWYVMNDAKEVYICLDVAKNLDGSPKPSLIEPNYNTLGVPYVDSFTTSDGYTWKLLYDISVDKIFKFVSSNHFPVEEGQLTLGSGETEAEMELQYFIKNAAIGGEIINAAVVTGGSAYTVAPTLTVIGDGSGATAVAHVSGGAVTRIEMTAYGAGYTNASFQIVGGGGTGCTIRAIITSADGIGFDPIVDLKTNAVMMHIRPDGKESNTFVVENTFRQMGVIKNPLAPDTSAFVAVNGKIMSTLTLITSSPFESGKTITGSVSGAIAHVNESVDAVVHFHQNESTGFKPFVVGDIISQDGVVLTGEVASISLVNGINRLSGEVLYIENRHRIRRDIEQLEDIKIVITV